MGGLTPGWKVWRFDQIATNVNVRADNPSEWSDRFMNRNLRSASEKWQADGRAFWQQMDALVETLDGLEVSETGHA